MEAIQRLGLEMKVHRKTIDNIQSAIKHEKQEMKRTLINIEEDVDGENDRLNYGLLHEYSNRICGLLRGLKEVRDLLALKTELYAKNA